MIVSVVSCCEGMWEGDEKKSGGKVVSGGGDGLVKLWDIQDGKEVLSMAGHTAEVVSTTWYYHYTYHWGNIIENMDTCICLCDSYTLLCGFFPHYNAVNPCIIIYQ